MEIFTSNFASAHRFDPERYCLVSISRFAPQGWDGLSAPAFAPSASLLKDYKQGYCSEEVYCIRYCQMLDSINVRNVFVFLSRYAQGRDIVLLCYEKAGAFCHRRLLASWVLDHFGYDIKEFSFDR